MTNSHLILHLHSPSLSPLYSSPFYIPFSTSPFHTPSISSLYNLHLHPFLKLVPLAPHWSQDKPHIWLTPLYHFLYTSSLHPFSTSLLYTTPLLYPLSTSTHLIPDLPLTLPLYVSTLPLYTPSLYSLSILLSTIPLYNPFLELIAPLVPSQPLHMTDLPLMLRSLSPSLSPLYILFLHSLSTPPSLTPTSSHMTSFLSILFFPSLYCPALHPLSTIGTAKFLLGFPPVTRQPPNYH